MTKKNVQKAKVQKATVKKQDKGRELIWHAAPDEDWNMVREWFKRYPAVCDAVSELTFEARSFTILMSILHKAITEYKENAYYVRR